MDHHPKLSRRSVLRGAVLLAGAALTAEIVPSKEALAQQKASQEAMQYHDKPNGDKRCSNCLSFIPSELCNRTGCRGLHKPQQDESRPTRVEFSSPAALLRSMKRVCGKDGHHEVTRADTSL
jgi:hypothetical protein